jgi:uncharacterized membrane protein
MKTWLMKRNCSLTPRRLIQFYAVLVGFSLAVAIGFLIVGVWMVLIFTFIELTAVTLGFLIYSRHALDFEEIKIDGAVLTITRFIGSKTEQFQMNARWTTLSKPSKNPKVFVLTCANQAIELGQFLRPEQQRKLLSELRPWLG